MRLAPLIACLIAAALLGAGSARVVATYNVLDVHTSNVPEAPPTVLTTALLNLTATEPIYVRPGRCQRNLVCNATNFVRCCSDDQCDPVTLTRLPTAPTDCACPSFPRVTCVDPSRPYAYGEAGAAWAFTPPNGFSFEIPIARSCRNTLITVSVIRGSFELYLGTASMTLREVRVMQERANLNLGRSFCLLFSRRPEQAVWESLFARRMATATGFST